MTDKDIFNEFDREVWKKAIYMWVHSEVDRNMLIRKHLDGLSVSEVAGEFNFSDKQCYRRLTSAKKQLFKHFKIVNDNITIK